MVITGKRRIKLFGASLLLMLTLPAGQGLHAAAKSNAWTELIAHADAIKTTDNAAFTRLLAEFDKHIKELSPIQQWRVRYFEGWQMGYMGELAKARPLLETVIRNTPDDAIRMHAAAALVNILGFSHQYEDAYAELDQALDDLPRVSDKDARFHLLGEASQLLAGAGQYELAASYADQIIEDYSSGRSQCIGMYLRAHANFLSGHLQGWNTGAQRAISACTQVNESLVADGVRRDVANLAIHDGRTADALALLESRYPSVVKYHYAEMTAEYAVLLAEAYWQKDDASRAEEYALTTIDIAKRSGFSAALSRSYQLLYQIERQKGNLSGALAYHEKYMEADKGRLDDIREKALAYQFVKQQVEAKKVELDQLNKQNQILQLQRALDRKAVETSRLYVALLLLLVISIGFWLFRLKQSQLRFMRLARRDGLTGIFNRQHFVDEAEQTLRYAAKSQRGACLILVDMDHFKTINDTHGHIVGDNVLRQAVEICQRHLHSCDVFGRIGGEEFGILLPECSLMQALERAEKIRVAIHATPDPISTEHITISASFGIATTTHHGYDLRRLLAAADTALYRAKRDGRNRVVVSMNENVPFHPGDEARSHQAIDRVLGNDRSCPDTLE